MVGRRKREEGGKRRRRWTEADGKNGGLRLFCSLAVWQ
jgi:hypothetical protein